jgi:hypothetical protein
MTKDELCRLEQSELVNLIDKGKLLYLSCLKGDIVYFVKSAFSVAEKPIEAKVLGIYGLGCNGEVIYRAVTEYQNTKTFTDADIGEKVFLNYEEAEAKLKEMEGK